MRPARAAERSRSATRCMFMRARDPDGSDACLPRARAQHACYIGPALTKSNLQPVCEPVGCFCRRQLGLRAECYGTSCSRSLLQRACASNAEATQLLALLARYGARVHKQQPAALSASGLSGSLGAARARAPSCLRGRPRQRSRMLYSCQALRRAHAQDAGDRSASGGGVADPDESCCMRRRCCGCAAAQPPLLQLTPAR